MINSENRERRDWTLLIFIIPLGIILIILVGQLAVRLVPFWRVDAGMNSNLEPNPESARPFALLEPILPQILTPMAWVQTYLTPGAEISFPPFLTFEPTATPSATTVTPTGTPPTPTATTPSPTSTAVTGTPPTKTPVDDDPPDDGTPPSTICTDPTANNNGGPLPCTYPPTTCTDPAANNQGQPLPCTYPPAICTDPAANNQGQPLPCTFDPICPGAHNPDGPLPCDYGVVSTPPASYGTPAPVPTEKIGVGTLPDNTGSGDDNIGHIDDESYIVLTLNVTVEETPDGNYDLALYEHNYQNAGYVNLDWIIVGISMFDDGRQYYEVFNWFNGTPDTNSNVGHIAQLMGTENDNQPIDVDELYDPDDAGPAPSTGILIDVDRAPSNPPPGEYGFVVLISPGGGSGDDADVDAVQAVEVEITPTP